MRRNWKDVLMLLDVSERLAGHPNLKGIRDEATQDLNELVSEEPRPQYYPPRVGPSDMAGATPIGATGPSDVHPIGSGWTGAGGSGGRGATGAYPLGPELAPGEHTQEPIDYDQEPDTKLNPELVGGGEASNPTGDNISDPIVRRKLS